MRLNELEKKSEYVNSSIFQLDGILKKYYILFANSFCGRRPSFFFNKVSKKN